MNEYIEIASKGLREMKNHLYKQTVKSQDNLNQPETHSTEVLLSTIEELEKVKKQLEIAVGYLKWIKDTTEKGHVCCDACGYEILCKGCENGDWAEMALKEIEELEK